MICKIDMRHLTHHITSIIQLKKHKSGSFVGLHTVNVQITQQGPRQENKPQLLLPATAPSSHRRYILCYTGNLCMDRFTARIDGLIKRGICAKLPENAARRANAKRVTSVAIYCNTGLMLGPSDEPLLFQAENSATEWRANQTPQ